MAQVVRCVEFHPRIHGWLVSSSDDMSARIWRWRDAECVGHLAGHQHYVMTAFWHPTNSDMLLTASMDRTVRLWNTSNVPKDVPAADEDGEVPEKALVAKATLMYLIETERSTNWAAFHPTRPLIVTAGEDTELRIWKLGATSAEEVGALRGHVGSVMAAAFYPQSELLISVSDDRSFRIWDVASLSEVASERRENVRFWCLSVHRSVGLFAVGHDRGLAVYQLEAKGAVPAQRGAPKGATFAPTGGQVSLEESLFSVRELCTRLSRGCLNLWLGD